MHYVTVDTLNSFINFERAFDILENNFIKNSDLFSPSVYFLEYGDGKDIEIDSDEWEDITGFSGQWSYGGPIMHPSEYLGGPMAQYVLDNPGTYAVTEVIDPDDMDAMIGWVLLRYIGENKQKG